MREFKAGLFWICISFGIVVIAMLELTQWAPFRVSGIRGVKFQDLQAILNHSKECFEASSYFDTRNISKCSESLNYGPLTAYIFYPVTKVGASAINLGYLLILSTHVIFSLIVSMTSVKFDSRFLLKLFFTVNPAVLLMYERGNLDSLCFIGLYLSTYLFLGRRNDLFILIVTLLGAIKLYPYAALLLLFLHRRKRLDNFYMGLALVTVFWTLVGSSRDFESNWYLSFGSQIFLVYTERLNPELINVGIGSTKGIALGLFFVLITNVVWLKYIDRNLGYRRELSGTIPLLRGVDYSIFLMGCLVHITSYLVTVSYDYRLVFFTLIVLTGEKEISRLLPRSGFLSWSALTLFIGSAYSAPFGLLPYLHLMGDVFHLFLLTIVLQIIWRKGRSESRSKGSA